MTTVMTTVISTNRTRPRGELKAALYAAAIKLFRERGYAGATVDSIVSAAGVAKGTFFNFFPAKIDVLKEYYRELDAEASRLRSRLDPGDPRKSLRNFARDIERIFRSGGALAIELLTLTISEPAMRRIDEESGALDTDQFAEFIRAAKREGVLRCDIDAGDAAHALGDLWSGSMRAWLKDPDRQSLPELFDSRVKLLIEGLRA